MHSAVKKKKKNTNIIIIINIAINSFTLAGRGGIIIPGGLSPGKNFYIN